MTYNTVFHRPNPRYANELFSQFFSISVGPVYEIRSRRKELFCWQSFLKPLKDSEVADISSNNSETSISIEILHLKNPDTHAFTYSIVLSIIESHDRATTPTVDAVTELFAFNFDTKDCTSSSTKSDKSIFTSYMDFNASVELSP